MKRYFELIKIYPGSQPLGTIFEKEYYSQHYNLSDTYRIFIKKTEVEDNPEYFKEVFYIKELVPCYTLIKEYPNSPKLGTNIKFYTSRNGTHKSDLPYNMLQVTNSPEFWEEVK